MKKKELAQRGEGEKKGACSEGRLEASLRRDEQRFPEALELLDRARAGCGGDPLAIGRVLLKRVHLFDALGEHEKALAALKEAVPPIEASGDRRLLFTLRFNLAANLCQLEDFAEAAALLPGIRDTAVQEANDLHLLRVVWLSSRIEAGLGRQEQAILGLEQVSRKFSELGLPYDSALASLDLAMIYLEAGQRAAVKALALTMGRIFRMKGIDREALASLSLFCEAVGQEIVTVELVRRVRSEVKAIRLSASSPQGRRGRG